MFACADCADDIDCWRAERFSGSNAHSRLVLLGLTNHTQLTNYYAIAKHSLLVFKQSKRFLV